MQYPLPDIDQQLYVDDHADKVIGLLGNAEFKTTLWRWQFHQRHQSPPIVMVDSQDKVKGFNGVMPVKVAINGDVVNAVWSCDFVVAADTRGKGVGKQVKLALQADYPRLMSLGISDSAVRVLSRMGWKQGDRVVTMRRLGSQRQWRDLVWLGCQKLLQYCFRQQVCAEGDLSWSDELPAKPQVDALSGRIVQDYPRMVVRDHDYLHWRYQRHPFVSYRYLTLTDQSGLIALLVVRDAAEHLRIVDYVGPGNERAIRCRLVKEVVSRYPASRVFSCTTSDPDWIDVLWREAFLPTGQQRFYVYSETDGEPKGWFLMAGDSDGELLQAARGATQR
ncbi:hypothetical protein ACFSJ3_08245 [Corallincola platygyrae]|uniref:N-acetyltransferase domain-containing protein n=1 Tax=Corallincola platygyrae TaxID=1193278 RepID=A0ABW4XK78_9GAMM